MGTLAGREGATSGLMNFSRFCPGTALCIVHYFTQATSASLLACYDSQSELSMHGLSQSTGQCHYRTDCECSFLRVMLPRDLLGVQPTPRRGSCSEARVMFTANLSCCSTHTIVCATRQTKVSFTSAAIRQALRCSDPCSSCHPLVKRLLFSTYS